MRMMWVAIAALVACKSGDKKADPAPSSGSGSGSAAVAPKAGSGSSGSAAGSGSAAPVTASPAAGKLEIDTEGATELALAFDKKVPKLPALSADRTFIAEWAAEDTGGPVPVTPWSLAISRVDGTGKSESLPLVDQKMMGDESWDNTPPDAATLKTLHERAAAITKRLAGFVSLVPVDIGNGWDEVKPTKVGAGDITFASSFTDDESIVLTLTRGGKTVRRATFESYSSDEKPASFMGGACSYRPVVSQVFMDPAKTALYTTIVYRYNEECSPQDSPRLVWSFAGEDPDPSAALAKDAVAITGSTVAPATAKPDTGSKISVTTSADGKTAWASLVAADGTRASYVIPSTADGWRVAAVATSKPVPNAKANADAKAKKIASTPFTIEPGDAALREAFAKLTTDGLTSPSAQLVAIGTAEGERTTTGPVLARAWNAGWKGKTTVTSSVARLAPSGTTGWVAATVEVAKPGYKMPLHVFAVFDKRDGKWTLVHIHFSV